MKHELVLACVNCGIILYQMPYPPVLISNECCPEEDDPLGAPPPEGDQSGREFEQMKKEGKL